MYAGRSPAEDSISRGFPGMFTTKYQESARGKRVASASGVQSWLLEEARRASKEHALNVTEHQSKASLNRVSDNLYRHTIDHEHPELTAQR
jgi:hypothetical protein